MQNTGDRNQERKTDHRQPSLDTDGLMADL